MEFAPLGLIEPRLGKQLCDDLAKRPHRQAGRIERFQNPHEGMRRARIVEQGVDERPHVEHFLVVVHVVQPVPEIPLQRLHMDGTLPLDAHRVDTTDRLDEPMLIIDIQRRDQTFRLRPARVCDGWSPTDRSVDARKPSDTL